MALHREICICLGWDEELYTIFVTEKEFELAVEVPLVAGEDPVFCSRLDCFSSMIAHHSWNENLVELGKEELNDRDQLLLQLQEGKLHRPIVRLAQIIMEHASDEVTAEHEHEARIGRVDHVIEGQVEEHRCPQPQPLLHDRTIVLVRPAQLILEDALTTMNITEDRTWDARGFRRP